MRIFRRLQEIGAQALSPIAIKQDFVKHQISRTSVRLPDGGCRFTEYEKFDTVCSKFVVKCRF